MSQNEMYRVLVVDDDAVCLTLLKAQLKKWNIYEVTTAKHAREALDMLRSGSYDLVVSDVHLPDFNGLQLLRQIDQEFHLPVILISADSRAKITGIAQGAQSFLVKPIEANVLKHIWQYALWWKKTKRNVTSIITERNESFQGDVQMANQHNGHHNNINDREASSSGSISTPPDDTTGRRKKKLIWTAQLHSRFVEAILVIGYYEAIPGKIVEVMNVPGISKEQVASHIQKYRKLLQDVLDGKTYLDYNNWVDLNYHSDIVSGNPDLLLLNQLREDQRNGKWAAGLPLPSPKQHNIKINVRAPDTSSSYRCRPLPPYNGAGPNSSENVTLNGLGNTTIPNAYNENVGSSSMPFGNNVAPLSGTAPLPYNFYSQPSINVGGQSSSNVYNANQTGNPSVMNAQQPDTEQMTDIESWFNSNEFNYP